MIAVIHIMEANEIKRDARSLDHATLEQFRHEIVRRRLAGETRKQVAASMQINVTTVSKIFSKYKAGGWAALASTKAPGPNPKLNARQQKQLWKVLSTRTPQQLKFSFALWTLPLIGEYITREFGVVLHETTISRMLRRMGITPQRPTRQAFQRDDVQCQAWAQTEFPRIVRDVQRRQAVLLFLDEAGVAEDGPVAHTWAPRGQTPVIRTTGKRRRVNVISAISPRGRLWFRCYGGTLDAKKFEDFLGALLHDVRGEIVLVFDRHPAHRAASTRRFIRDHGDRLRVHHLPSYAPDLNPDEHVWSYLKGMFRREPLGEDEDFLDAVHMSMDEIRSNRKLVKSFFDHPAVEYVRTALHWA